MLIKDATFKDLIIGRKVKFPNGNFAIIVGVRVESPNINSPRYTEIELFFLHSQRRVNGNFIPYCKDAELLDEYISRAL